MSANSASKNIVFTMNKFTRERDRERGREKIKRKIQNFHIERGKP